MNPIGIDTRLTAYRTGGISTYIRRLIEALEPLRDDFTVLESRREQHPISQRMRRATLWTPPHHRLEKWTLAVELIPHQLEILHSPDFIPPLFGARRYIITVHDLTFLHYPQHKDRAAQRYYNDQIKWAVQKADHILSVSEATRQDLMTMLNVPADKITVQPHGVDPHFKPLNDLTDHIGLPESYILHVGTLEPRKNIPALLDAYERIKPDLPLLFVGRTGWLFDTTLKRIKSLQSAGYPIIIREDIDDDMLPLVYNKAHILVFPSFYEGFGLPALEAMACGTPVIISNCSSLPEVVGESGLYIDPHDTQTLVDALKTALHNDTWRQAARQAGIDRAKHFTWGNSAQIALSVYERMLR